MNDGIREIILNLRLSLISICIDSDPDYFFGLGCIWFENKKTFMGRSLLSFRLDKGYSVTCYMDVLFFRIYFKDWTGHYKQKTIINRLINKL